MALLLRVVGRAVRDRRHDAAPGLHPAVLGARGNQDRVRQEQSRRAGEYVKNKVGELVSAPRTK